MNERGEAHHASPSGVAAPADAAGFVLAGGRSSRMGADKALELLAGRPLIAHALDLLRAAGLPASIVGASSPLGAFVPVIADLHPGLGPLGGICSALAAASAQWAVFLPVDLPLLPASLVVYLLRDAQQTGAPVTLASVNGFVQSFPAVVCKSVLPVLQNELEAGRGGCFSAFQAAAAHLGQPLRVLPVEFLLQAGHLAQPEGMPATRWFLNVNARAQIEWAEHICRVK